VRIGAAAGFVFFDGVFFPVRGGGVMACVWMDG